MSSDCWCDHGRAEHDDKGCMKCACWYSHDELVRAGVIEGEVRKAEGIALIIDSESPELDEWRETAYRWMDGLRPGVEFTSTDLVDAIGIAPSPNAVGAVVRATAQRGSIRKTDRYVKSARPTCHAAIVAVWVRA